MQQTRITGLIWAAMGLLALIWGGSFLGSIRRLRGWVR